MYSSSGDSFPAHQYIHPLKAPQRCSSRFLTSIKTLVRRPFLPKLLFPSQFQTNKRGEIGSPISHIIDPTQQPRQFKLKTRLKQPSWHRRRRNVPVTSMADYLTLAQLENFWHQQEFDRADVMIPRAIPEQTCGPLAKQNRGWQFNQLSNIHPALRSGYISTLERGDESSTCYRCSELASRWI